MLRGSIAERGGVRIGHCIIEINNQSVVAVSHEKIVKSLATSVGDVKEFTKEFNRQVKLSNFSRCIFRFWWKPCRHRCSVYLLVKRILFLSELIIFIYSNAFKSMFSSKTVKMRKKRKFNKWLKLSKYLGRGCKISECFCWEISTSGGNSTFDV